MPGKSMIARPTAPSPKSPEAGRSQKRGRYRPAPLRYRFSLPAASSDAAGFIFARLLERWSRLD